MSLVPLGNVEAACRSCCWPRPTRSPLPPLLPLPLPLLLPLLLPAPAELQLQVQGSHQTWGEEGEGADPVACLFWVPRVREERGTCGAARRNGAVGGRDSQGGAGQAAGQEVSEEAHPKQLFFAEYSVWLSFPTHSRKSQSANR